ncbi:MAG: hypothetical protein A2W22_05770 [Candidatus Levybacteria bacterium RBG_16_35_11]|nr:MAG: hypothetical protein A2W22_05770 [Candidatus Levybacteria bacterium RBG_16_35_11]
MTDIFVAERENKLGGKKDQDNLTSVKKQVPPFPEIEPKKENPPAREEEKKQRFAHEELIHFKSKEIGLFSSFHLYPINVSFKEQEENEEIILLLRKHFVTNFYWIFLTVVLIFLPIIFFLNRSLFPVPPIPDKFNVMAFLLYFTIIGAYVYINFITWFFNTSLITQKRLVDVHFVDIIYHDMAVTRLNLIEDISFTQSGFIKSFFNYGDIYVQTAGEKLHFDFLAVPEPDHVLNVIENLMGGEKNVQ